ncbi:SPOSA6832_02804 [Sporobolomyces salmonicolor]|uniref:SPOSA6832_02804-mRNA-1:cds n=1 Tax=Sporidiobolus salmonicolor TaxID=5005 RepID=A0A0D6EMD3_SPOSA|nr:SPOSA6832_02804 [Sporobolomyces salmonicolor]
MDPEHPLVTPSRPPPPVDISTIEAAKENIVPLHSGRSASQLAALSSSSRSGLGLKLDQQHARFHAQIAAVDVYEATGAWEDGRDGLTVDEVAQLAEDPLDISHQYVRFIVANYPAGASAANKLVPVLEEMTRKFLGDGRYTNDPRYFRLWAHYAKNLESPEECYRFLFAKGVAEKLAALYEEYAKVLEAAGKRKQADQIYLLGINRRATPLDRLKRSHLDFQARMLIAPPLPSPPRPSAGPSSSTARPILSSSTSRPLTGGTGGTGVGPAGNGSAFAVFRDEAGKLDGGKDAEWDDFGTVKSRKRENELEKKEWAGETMPQRVVVGGAAALGGGFKLEVYRDETATSLSTAHSLAELDVFSRSTRSPSEAELLRHNPFKNYPSTDSELAARDPLENLDLPHASSEKEKKKSSSNRSKSVASSTSSSSSRAKSKSTSASSAMPPPASSGDKPKERVAVDLKAIYPSPGVEYSFEELRARNGRYKEEAETWGGWEARHEWEEEVARLGTPLYDFLPRPSLLTPEPVQPELSPSPAPASPSPASPTPPSFQPQHSLLSPSPPRRNQPAQRSLNSSPSPQAVQPVELVPLAVPASSVPAANLHCSPSRSPSPAFDVNRPPSPTINTKAANALVDNLFAKTLDFTRMNRSSSSSRSSDSDSGEGEASTDDSDDDDDDGRWNSVAPLDIGGSQFSTQQATQASEISSDAGFVPFSQTRSQMGDDSAFFGSQEPGFAASQQQHHHQPASAYGRGLFALTEENGNADDNDENSGAAAIAKPAPMQLFRDAVPATPSGGGFRPVTKTGSARAPLGAKPLGGALSAPPPPPAFAVFQDQAQPVGVFGEPLVPSSQPQENGVSPSAMVGGGDDSFDEEEEYEAPLRGDGGHSDGYAMGRRERGVPSRYAPFVDNMTPITERTLEITAAMTTASLSASQRSRRESAFPNTATVEEEDEEEEPSTEEDEDDGDRAFVASYAGEVSSQANARDDDDSSEGSSSESSSDSDDDDGDLAPPPVHHELQPIPPAALTVLPDPAPASFDESSASRISLGEDRSFDVSLNTSIPEGFTITGNQSGMTTGMIVADLSRTSDAAPVVDPYEPKIVEALLAGLTQPVLQHPDVRSLVVQPAARLAELQKTAKKREKSKGSKDRTGVIDEAWDLELDGEVFSVREKLGEGSFGAVFRIALPADGDDEDASFDVDAGELSVAVKIEKPTNLWEFHVLDQLHTRLPERIRTSVVSAHRLYAYADESYLFLDFCDQGSLLDAVNKANESGVSPPTGGVSTGLDELLAMFFVVELLRILEGFHDAGFIHGDLKIDNCLLRLDDVPGGGRAWSSAYDASGSNGWGAKGLKIIDFGRTVDWSRFPPGQQFNTVQESDELDCAEMREGKPWSFEPDYFGVASIAFNLLFGRYIETKKLSASDGAAAGGKWVINQNFRRYHQTELWTRLFDMLLNPHEIRSDASLPITPELGTVRTEMEAWLAANCDKNGKSLKGLIKKLEIYSMSR